MARRYKLIIIILICAILTYIIFNINKDKKLNIVALGDGIASGETEYNTDGISYNDYLNNYYAKYHLLKKYNDSYTFKNNKLTTLIDNIHDNDINKNNSLNINQLLHDANLITIGIGEDELTKLCITNDLNIDVIKVFIRNYDYLLTLIKNVTESQIIVIGLYENYCLSRDRIIILNSEISNICYKNNITFINVSDMIKDNNIEDNNYYFNHAIHKNIFNALISSI